MPMFALYYIPPAESALYKAGSELLGYDIRAEQFLPTETPARAAFSQHTAFDPQWAVIPQEFGFHVTIGHAITFDAGRLPELEAETEALLRLLDPAKPFTLTPADPYLSNEKTSLTVYYHANPPLMMFHAMVVARLHTLGLTTPLREALHAGQFPDMADFLRTRVETYMHYSILDDWFPHFGVLRPVPLDRREAARAGVLAALPSPTPLTVDSVCLLIKDDGKQHFRIHREYRLPAAR